MSDELAPTSSQFLDYDADAPITNTFYATVQNKLHWAIVGRTRC